MRVIDLLLWKYKSRNKSLLEIFRKRRSENSVGEPYSGTDSVFDDGAYQLTLNPLRATIVVFIPFCQPITSLLFGIKLAFKHEDLQMFRLQLKKIWIIFSHLKLRFAVAKHNFKRVKIKINLAL